MSAPIQSTAGEAVILDAERIERCIQRIARQILEDHHGAVRVVVPAVLWIVLGVIFIGALHDYAARSAGSWNIATACRARALHFSPSKL